LDAQSNIYWTDSWIILLPAILLAPSITPAAVNAQHDPHPPYFSGKLTALKSLQSCFLGKSRIDNFNGFLLITLGFLLV